MLKELQKKKKDIIKKKTIALKKQELINVIDKATAKGVPLSDISRIIGFKSGTDNIGRVAKSKNFETVIQVLKERPQIIKELSKYKADLPEKIEKREQKSLVKKAKKMEKITGVVVTGNNSSKLGVPNPDVLEMNKKDYIDERIEKNALSDDPTDIKQLRRKASKEYDDAKKMAQKININQINKESIQYGNDLLDTYFENLDGQDKQRIIKEYYKLLDVQKRYDMLDIITTSKFLGVYDSDPENSGYDSGMTKGARAELRADQLIKILQNETGLVFDKIEGHNITFKPVKYISEHYTFDNMID